ncbi:hypothetical protein HO173_007972 [Letharia columbiana]|uniref:RCC1-like domain-containing protein n=1 Tax=Letharia columbiana TaxID=112416 RepID=A0A8H6FS90_9LECA|nr:uncharacterized protein HO173_007972 [Letharia columbiana]KAF6233760.1 hypothetical protein HO173_007972 [Letharia columbiana]
MVLYGFGSNGSGQLGIGNTVDQSTPQRCWLNSELPGSPMTIAAGGNHTLVLYDEGTVYSAGSSRDAKLHSRSSMSSMPIFQTTYVSVLGNKVKLCSALWDGSIFVNSENEVYTAALGSKGEQGTGGISGSMALQILPNFPPVHQWSKIVDVACGVDHAVVVLNDGIVYGWGNGRKGQLSYPEEIVCTPRRLAGVGFKVVRAVCGRDFTYLVGEQSSGQHTVLGSSKWEIQSQAPALVPDWKDIGASWGSIFVLEGSGKIRSWGRNDHGQLAPPGLPHIEKIAVGSEHVIALTKEGKVISWGWGEHGNCGSGTDESGDVKGKWNEILDTNSDHSMRVIGVGAGCATSFFWAEDPES